MNRRMRRDEAAIYESLVQKVHPSNWLDMVPKFAAVLGYVLGKHWTSPEIGRLEITEDGKILADGQYLGEGWELDQAISWLFVMAGVTSEEWDLWDKLYRKRVRDRRRR